ncbi:unnamed protein product [Spirodela intermedia]|uniref:rRNA methyltransferase 1, mitochondrial n=1 Tax=Spirodela intermedia TaxID=51605 RepID=A0A7I8KQK1_SPIIN|nr:unnamed protein product [Spirodela intermedia]
MYCCGGVARRPTGPPLIAGISRGWSRCSSSTHGCNVEVRILSSISSPSTTEECSGRRIYFSQPGKDAPASGLVFQKPWMSAARCFSGDSGPKVLGTSAAKTLVKGEVLGNFRVFSHGARSKQLGNACFSRLRHLSTGTHQKSAGDRPRFAACADRGFRRSKKVAGERNVSSSWEASADSYFSRASETPAADAWRNRDGKINVRDSRRRSPMEERRSERESPQEEESEPIDDPRWKDIRAKYDRIIDRESRYERPEVARWNRQESWGRNAWKQATESSVPKMVGESVYGVSPVLAALTAGRREFYTLYVRDGLDLSGNNKKKKDKKGIEKILKMADEIGLTIKEASKHDLNMVVDNRPHQGLILDASPLEMVGIRELVPVSMNEGERAPLWIALDEVMDPQNLGAIIRSAYFFGVEGVVLCAKNSAPLSGVVSKASAGSLEMIELRSCKNMMQFLASSVENGWRVLGGSVSPNALPLGEVKPGAPTVLVLGSEGTGLRPLVERSCTDLVRIPGNAPVDGDEEEEEDGEFPSREFKPFLAVESLNVSVAAGVLLYHLAGNAGGLKESES